MHFIGKWAVDGESSPLGLQICCVRGLNGCVIHGQRKEVGVKAWIKEGNEVDEPVTMKSALAQSSRYGIDTTVDTRWKNSPKSETLFDEWGFV